MQIAGTTPSPHSTQNIDNKETAKIFPRKVLHSKELDVEILIRKELRRKMRPAHELPLGRGSYLIVTLGIAPDEPRIKAF
jgi:hypothetical protein